MQESSAVAESIKDAVKYVSTYSNEAASFIKYPREHENVYLALGLASEAGELFDALMQSGHGSASNVLLECGDVMWYATMLLRAYDVDATELMKTVLNTHEYDERATAVSAAAIITVHAGAIAGRMKKVVRGDLITHSDQRRVISHAVGMIYLAVFVISHRFGQPMLEVMMSNIDKLSGREDRGTLLGDGDER